MPITANSPLSSSVANDTFMDQQVDTQTVGRIGLNNVLAESGDAIANAQQKINENSLKDLGSITLLTSESITLDEVHKIQYVKVEGNGGAVTLNTPFANQPKDKTKILLVGSDDTNTVTFEVNDSVNGLYVNGNATLLRGYILELIYDAQLQRFLEVGRNF